MREGIKLQQFAGKLHLLAEKLLDYANGRRQDGLESDEHANISSKIFAQTKDYFDKTVNNHGNMASLLQSMNHEDKNFLVQLKLGEKELKNIGKNTIRR